MSPEATPPFDLSRLEHARIDGPGVTMAYMGEDKSYVRPSPCRTLTPYLMVRAVRQRAPMESLLRSALLVLMDNTTAEYAFITMFFSPEGDPIPVRKETPMSPPIAHENLPRVSPDDEMETPTGALSATTSTSLATPVTVDMNSNPAPNYSIARGATPHLNPPMQLSKEDQAVLNAVWKQITGPAVEYTQASTLLRDIC